MVTMVSGRAPEMRRGVYSFEYLSLMFGFSPRAFVLPPARAHTLEDKNAWQQWLHQMEEEFATEHYKKPAYPDFTKSDYSNILSQGQFQFEAFLEGNKRYLPSIVGGNAWSQNGHIVSSHYPMMGRVLASSSGFENNDELSLQSLQSALAESLRLSQPSNGYSWGTHENWPQRVGMLMVAARIAVEEIPIMLAAMVSEVGMSPREAWGEYDEVIDYLRYYAIEAAKIYLEEWMRAPEWKGSLHGHMARSHGVAAVLAPFNFPAAIGASMIGSALVMGNTVVHCPSEKTIACGYLVYKNIFRNALDVIGVPPGHINHIIHYVVSNRGDAVRKVLACPEVGLWSFTGSSDVAASIKKEFGTLRRWHGGTISNGAQELSGVNPVYVHNDADMPFAAKTLPGSFLGRSGHKCSSARNIMVNETVYARFKTLFLEAIDAITYGNVWSGAFLGPVVSSEIAGQLHEKIEKLVRVVLSKWHIQKKFHHPMGLILHPLCSRRLRQHSNNLT